MTSASGSLAPPLLLVIEDSDEDFDTCCDAARRAGVRHAIRRISTGDECLEYLADLQRQADPSRPALVLLDLNTPAGDGREALVMLKADPRLRSIPVVVLTTSSNPRDVGFCYRAGVNAYHVKPVRYPEHLRVLETVFGYWLHGGVVLPEDGGPNG